MMEAVRKQTEFLTHFEAQARVASGPLWLQEARREALTFFLNQGFPTTRDEEWKYTNLAPLFRTEFRPAPAAELTWQQVRQSPFAELGCPRIVFVNGAYAPELSDLQGLAAGVDVSPLSEALQQKPRQVEPYLGQIADYQESVFAALNLALFGEGVCVLVGKGVVPEAPLHVLHVSSGKEAFATFPRLLLAVAESSQLKIVETYISTGAELHWTNAVSEIFLSENAVVDHYKLQAESKEAYHTHTFKARQERSSSLRSQVITLGALLTRNNVTAVLDGEGSDCGLNGLYLVNGRQHVDNHTRMDHAQPHCSSREMYKGILDEEATGVFHGRIVVHKDAQKTDSKQTNKNLLLSKDALINTKPQLEIYADDVKCTHGATIGQLDADAIFYLRSRGIDEKTAYSLLIYAFAGEVVDKIRVPSLHDRVNDYLFNWLPKGELVREAV